MSEITNYFNSLSVSMVMAVFGVGAVLLPGLLLIFKIRKMENKKKFMFLFVLINTLEMLLVAYVILSLISVFEESLLPSLVVLSIYIILNLLILIKKGYDVFKIRKSKNLEVVDSEMADDKDLQTDNFNIDKKELKARKKEMKKNKKLNKGDNNMQGENAEEIEDPEIKALLDKLFEEAIEEELKDSEEESENIIKEDEVENDFVEDEIESPFIDEKDEKVDLMENDFVEDEIENSFMEEIEDEAENDFTEDETESVFIDEIDDLKGDDFDVKNLEDRINKEILGEDTVNKKSKKSKKKDKESKKDKKAKKNKKSKKDKQ